MINYYKYAQFNTCTPLSGILLSNIQLDISWTVPTTNLYDITKIELYRYIGDLNNIVNTPTETDVNSKLIYTTTDNNNGTFTRTTDYFNGNVTTTTNTNTIIGINNFIDNLNNYYNTNTLLITNHNITDCINDKTAIEEILKTKRVIYYILLTYIRGYTKAVPYCIGSHSSNNIIDNTSTKTQVINNTLNFEGDIIWITKLTQAGTAQYAISRTSLDLKNGYVWISESKQGYVYKCDLLTGLQLEKYENTAQLIEATANGSPIYGHAIVALDTGDCLSLNQAQAWSSLGYTPHQTAQLIQCKNLTTGDETTVGSHTIVNSVCPTFGWGATRINNSTNRISITPNNIDDNDFGIIDTGTGVFTQKINSRLFPPDENSGPGGYAWCVCSGPDSNVFYTKHDTLTLVTQNLNTTYTTNNFTNTKRKHRTIIADNYNMWPNLNGSLNNYHLIGCSSPETGSIEDFVVNSNNPFNANMGSGYALSGSIDQNVISTPNISGSFQCVGIDGENNIWGLGANRVIVYRMPFSTTFPTGGECRYPSITLEEQPYSTVNIPQIEWFLLLDSGYVDTNVTAVGILNNTITANYNNDIYTAHTAWWSLVDNKRFEINPSGTFPTLNGFDVDRKTSGISNFTRNYGIRMKNTNTCLSAIELWYNVFANPESDLYYNGNVITPTILALSSINITNKRVKPWYGATTNGIILSAFYGNLVNKENNTYLPGFANGDTNTSLNSSFSIIFKNWFGESFPYSDFTGNFLTGSEDSIVLNKNIIYPIPSNPFFQNNTLGGYRSNTGYQEVYPNCYPWKTVAVSSNSLSGYDKLTMINTLTVNMGTFDINKLYFYSDDFNKLTYQIINNNINPNVYNIEYKYNYPSKIGLYYLPSGNNSSIEYLQNSKLGGEFLPTFSISALNIYTNTILSAVTSASVVVLERWPEPKTYLEISDLQTVRTNIFSNSSWGIDRYDKSLYIRKESNSTDAIRNNISYGVDPVHIIFKDRSIARTFPLSSWTLTISTNNINVGWFPTTAFNITTNSNLKVSEDEQNFYDTLCAFDFRYGNYLITMNVAASTTSTSSDKNFINYVQISEFEPFANFWPSTAYTVDSSYSCDNPTTVAKITGNFPNGNNTNYSFVSGYAPVLTVYFQDSSEAHTFPISEYNWNFGDYYNEGSSNVFETSSNYYTLTTNNVSGSFDSPNWKTNTTAHTAAHTYTIPGTYDVTLTIKASCTNTTDLCARYLDGQNVKKFNIYVEEILPVYREQIKATDNITMFNSIPTLSGTSPQTMYFCGSGITAGSFPICKMVWNFGDGTLETITRSPSSDITSQGLSISYHLDPRNTIVPHIFTNNASEAKTYNVSVSAYTCNTNTMITTGFTNMIGPIYNQFQTMDEKRRLLGSRFDSNGNIVYIFEGLTTKNTYTVVMSGDI